MSSRTIKPTKKLGTRSDLPEGANVAVNVTEYKCLCGKGRIEYHVVPGFDDDYFYIACPNCDEKIKYMTWVGYDWEIYE